MAGNKLVHPANDIFCGRPEFSKLLAGSRTPSSSRPHCHARILHAAPVQLYTATLVHCWEDEMIHGFYAVVGTAMSHLFWKLLNRLGPEAAGQATLAQGFDPSDPLVVSLVSDALADMLVLIDAEPASPLADGLDIQFESRFRLN